MWLTKQSYVNLNVREVYETATVEEAKEISKKVNLEIERKREELRMLVGERYRDLIDAADTIGTMRTTSVSVFEKLTLLRDKLNSLPTQLAPVKTPKEFDKTKRLNPEELEISAELKLSLETPRQIQILLDGQEIIPSLHLYLFYCKNLAQTGKPYQWSFLSNSGYNSKEVTTNIEQSILEACHETFDDFEASFEKLTECLIAKQILTKSSCETVLMELLERRLKKLKENLIENDPDFVTNIASTAEAIYAIFIHPQLYSSVLKSMKKPNIGLTNFGLKFLPKSVQIFNQETIPVQEPPRVTQLAEIIKKSYVLPLKQIIQKCFEDHEFMSEFKTFEQLQKYQTETTKVLKKRADELMRVVLGTSNTTNLWTEAFSPTFQRKCRQIAQLWTGQILKFLEEDAFPRFLKLDDQFDLVSFVWKPPALNDKSSMHLDVDLKLKCLSPHLAGICEELEWRFQEVFKDFQILGDPQVKLFLSSLIVEEIQKFCQRQKSISNTLFLGRFCSALTELCPPLWKLVEKQDGVKLKESLAKVCESSWTEWVDKVMDKFVLDLESKMRDLSPFMITSFMPVGEDFIPQKEDEVKPSIRIPFQPSHTLHSLLFGICVSLAKVGPQSVAKSVRENFRLGLGIRVAKFYEKLIEDFKKETCLEKTEMEDNFPAQVAIQFIFDLKYCQWFHPKLSESVEPIISTLQSYIDPFDLDIVNPKLKINLKRFLFETHLTLGLLLSEESHSFIAQNFKTKQNQSFPMANPTLYVPLPLLPI